MLGKNYVNHHKDKIATKIDLIQLLTAVFVRNHGGRTSRKGSSDNA